MSNFIFLIKSTKIQYVEKLHQNLSSSFRVVGSLLSNNTEMALTDGAQSQMPPRSLSP